VIWTASLAANTGTWMYTAASSWLMTSLSPDPLIVSLVQVAASLPIFLLAIPAGALADIIDRRRFLIIGVGQAIQDDRDRSALYGLSGEP
jgi:MFS family permease